MIVDSDSDPEEDYLALDERNIAEEIVEQPVLQSN